jgi:ATP-binding cassette subfamily B protein
MDPIMSAICLIGGPFLALAMRKLSQRILKAMHGQVHSVSTIVGAMRETSQGIGVIKAFQLEGQQRERMHRGIHAVERLSNKMVSVQAGMNGLVEILVGLAIGLVVLYAGWRNLSSGDTPGLFFAFIAALLMAVDPLRRLSRLRLQLAASAVGAQMMYDLLDTPAAEKAVPAPELAVHGGEVRLIRSPSPTKPARPRSATSISSLRRAARRPLSASPEAGRPRSSTCCSGFGCPNGARSRSTGGQEGDARHRTQAGQVDRRGEGARAPLQRPLFR